MIKITQTGYNFAYYRKRTGQLAETGTWNIERVAALLFVVEFHRLRSQKYVKGMTFCAAYGSIQVELENVDVATNRDIQKLVNLMSPYHYDDGDETSIFFTDFNSAIDLAEKIIKEKVESLEEPTEIFGRTVTPPRFLGRMTKEEYDAIDVNLVAEQERKDKEARKSEVVGGTIKVWFKDYGILPCKIIRETATGWFIDVYKGGECILTNRRIAKNTDRIIRE